ncbi:MAG TPA: pre-peptidase C-terminal domain-containing protein [Elainellaceae cyanobacterium]
MTQYNIGALSGSIVSRNNYSVTPSFPTDVFQFSLDNTRDINLYLHNISAGDDADVRLYRDSNSNGVLDASDTYLTGSFRAGNATDSASYLNASAGTYFARVNRYSPGSFGAANYSIDLSSTYDVGTLGVAPISRNSYNVSANDPIDVFEFDVVGTRNINLNLHDISAGDDVDLRLFRDVNSNGLFDANDRQFGLLDSSRRGSNRDDSINYRATSGTYFAQAERYAPGSSGTAHYSLDFSSTPVTGLTSGRASNLVAEEVRVGNLSGDRLLSGNVNNADTSDIYSFSLGFYEATNIRLSGLTADADIRLIRDTNSNQQVDAGEVLRTSIRGGALSEQISGVHQSGDYYLQVYQYSGNTNYNLTFDHYTTSYA